jgi:hypothetical protein
LTIYLTEGTCGQVEDEVCFGKVLDGFDSLNKVESMRQPIMARSVKVQEDARTTEDKLDCCKKEILPR